jgi:cyclophilin family peptidyl-prolyl cis-trans isomerase
LKQLVGLNSCGRALARLALCLVLFAAACGGKTETKDFDDDAAGGSADLKVGVAPEPDPEVAVLEMEDPAYGQIVIELYPNIAPQMVERFKTLARAGFYNGTTFHRVEPPTAERPGGVIQGGEPSLSDDDPTNGEKGSGYPDLPAELSDVPYELGTVGAARTSDLDTANCQFFISLGRNAMWDRQYTVFGHVLGTSSLNNVKIIGGTPTRPGTSSPITKVVIKSITLRPRAGYVAQ